MKNLIALLLLLWSAASAAANPTFNKLAEVNRCWLDQQDVNLQSLPAYRDLSETQWIRLHLSLVEQKLRERSTAHLNPAQVTNRMKALSHLHEYWVTGTFPKNEDYSYRTPIFIDKYNTFCAVGYLVKTSGHEAVSRMIAAKTNLAYVKDMNYPELDQWAAGNGFSKEELAWIQPGYPPGDNPDQVGDGVDGVVNRLYADDANGKLYVGGSFSQAGALQANNIAYVTEANDVYTWHAMGDGINGTVNAIVAFNGKIYVAGSFTEAGGQAATNVAYWDGSSWHSMGCTYGTIYDMLVYKNELYISGSFDVCAAMSDVHVARWNGTNWQQVFGLTGRVNTMEVVGDDLVLGGAFTYQNEIKNVIRWNAADDFVNYASNIANAVMDFQLFHDTLYAACKQTIPSQLSPTLYKLSGDNWTPAVNEELSFTNDGPVSFNTLSVFDDRLMIGGDFDYNAMMGIYGVNLASISGTSLRGEWMVDSTINTSVIFKGSYYAGGAFRNGGMMGNEVVLNGIAKKQGTTTGIQNPEFNAEVTISPNPVAGGRIDIKNSFAAQQLTMTDISGRLIGAQRLDSKRQHQRVTLPEAAPGLYLLRLSNEKGQQVTKKVVVK